MHNLTQFAKFRRTEQGEVNGPTRSRRKKHQRGDISMLEFGTKKFKKHGLKNKTGEDEQKKIILLPYEIVQLEEAISSSNPLKVKLHTLMKEHLGYSSDFRCNFQFGCINFLLHINPTTSITSNRTLPPSPSGSASGKIQKQF